VSGDRDDAGIGLDVGEVVVFMLGQQRYALPIDRVQEIQQIVAMNEVPDSTRGLVGVINLRGDVVPAIDLRQLLGMEHRQYVLETPMVITRARGSLAALIVDGVEDVAAVPPGAIQPPDDIYELADRMIGVCRLEGELVFILDPDELLPERVVRAVHTSPDEPEAADKKPRPRKARASSHKSSGARKKADQ
jgi:purine-binding chemotaxis protein CheW